MKILLGVDDSSCSKAAIGFIKKMARPPGTKVLVVAVARMPVQAYSEVYAGAANVQAEAWEMAQRVCEDIASRAEAELKGAGLVTEARVLTGDPRDALVDLAETERPDLMVVGSHGRTGFSKLVMGSVATHVVTHAPCTVVVVKDEEAGK